MAKTLKVWAGMSINANGKQVRVIVAAFTKKQAIEVSGEASSRFNGYWCETGNARELAVATEVGKWEYDGNEYNSKTKIVRVK